MMGVYFSWVILLFRGAGRLRFSEPLGLPANPAGRQREQRGREFVALRLMISLGRRFQTGQRPATIFQLSAELGIPSPLTQSVLAHAR